MFPFAYVINSIRAATWALHCQLGVFFPERTSGNSARRAGSPARAASDGDFRDDRSQPINKTQFQLNCRLSERWSGGGRTIVARIRRLRANREGPTNSSCDSARAQLIRGSIKTISRVRILAAHGHLSQRRRSRCRLFVRLLCVEVLVPAFGRYRAKACRNSLSH